MGANNTDFLHTYPITPNTHPYLQQHDIAATLCTDFQSVPTSNTHDWFLPSFREFEEMLQQVGPTTVFGSTLNLQTDTEDSKDWYWTSSAVNDTWLVGMPPPIGWELERFSWAFNVNTQLPFLTYRCHALSVRPIRRFECEPIDCGCTCVDYNYRDANCGLVHGTFCSGAPTGSWGESDVLNHWATIQGGSPVLMPWNDAVFGSFGDEIIGADEVTFQLNQVDVKGNEYTSLDFQNVDSN